MAEIVRCAYCRRRHRLRPAYVGYENEALCATCEREGESMISDTDLNKLTQLGIPRDIRRDAVIALNLNGVHSERKARNARARCAAYWTTLGMDDPLAKGVS